MTWLVLITALLQSAWVVTPDQPSVGDTVSISLSLPFPPGAHVRAFPLESGELIESLAPPGILPDGPVVRIEYLVAAFVSGEHAIPMPDLELVRPDGRTETVSGGAAVIRVRAVLPASDTLLHPRASRAPIARVSRTPLPAVLLVGGTIIATVLWALWIRRPGRPRTRHARAAAQEEDSATPPPLMRWVAAGEPRVVAAVAAEEFRLRLAALVPGAKPSLGTEECLAALAASGRDLPEAEVAEVLRQLERARFAPAVPSDVVELLERANLLLGVPNQPAGVEEPER